MNSVDSQAERLTDGPRRRSWLPVGTRYLAAIIGLTGILAFIVVSITVNAQPDTSPFRGWIAVLQEADGATGSHQLKLVVNSTEPGARGRHPELTYTAAVCGNQSFRGVLVLGGNAQLNHARAVGPSGSDTDVETLSNLKLGYPADAVALGQVQLVRLDIENPTPCLPEMADTSGGFVGTPVSVAGRLESPIQRTWSFFAWWDAPRSSQAWPLVGGIPGFPPQALGVFDATDGLSGSWQRIPGQRNLINGGGLTGRATVEIARPEPTSTTGLTWESREPLQPVARVTDVDAMSAWQQRLVVAGIWLGIGSSLLATMLLEVGRSTATVSAPVQSTKIARADDGGSARSVPRRNANTARQAAHGRPHRDNQTVLVWAGVLLVVAAAAFRPFLRIMSRAADGNTSDFDDSRDRDPR